jgi:hypothetical protein
VFGALEAGGTKMVCAIGDENGQILDQISVPTTTPDETMPKIIEYFKDKNMEYFKEWINDLTNCVNVTNNGRYVLVIAPKAYYSQTEDCKLASITWCKLTDIIDSMGGSCYVEDLPGTEVTVCGTLYRIATKEEVYQIYEMYRRAEKNHEKKVDSYLKRYGTSKVNSWTYWRDA